MWRKLRIVVLLVVLATVAQRTWLQSRDLEWRDNLYVAVYPINADGSAQTTAYLDRLRPEQFEPIAQHFAAEAQRYGLKVGRPFEFVLGPEITRMPPRVPHPTSMLAAVLWSLEFRWWAWRNSPAVQMPADIRLYLMYYDPGTVAMLAHSTALNKGRAGLVNVFGREDCQDTNAVVIAHELLHTVGATDKYDPGTNLPHFPEGYAEPGNDPLYPQEFAELMAGRVPMSTARAEMPATLAQTLIGEMTAKEIRWLKAD